LKEKPNFTFKSVYFFPAKIEQTFKVNSLAHFWTVKAFLPGMIAAKRGHIVTISSLAGMFSASKLVDYCASKFAAVGFAEALGFELQRFEHQDDVKNSVICPFYIKSPLFEGAASKILPVLEPDFVAEEIVKAVLTNTEMVILPWYVKYLVILKALVPVASFNAFAEAFGSNNTMDSWTGRKKQA